MEMEMGRRRLLGFQDKPVKEGGGFLLLLYLW